MTRLTIRPVASIAVATALVATLAACSASDEPQTLTVHAAASLTGAMGQIEADFEAAHEGVDVTLNLGGSSGLAAQITEGAPGDVFASADQAQMTVVTDAGLADTPEDFASNALTIAVAPGNPLGITDLASLAASDATVVVCAAPVPCGAVTEEVEAAAGVTLSPVSEEQAVTDVLAKVTSGQADAGLVYVTDVAGSDGAADAVALGGDDAIAAAAGTTYPIATLTESVNPDLAQEFVKYVLSEDGQATLASFGFGAP
ncbi:MAG: molybdate ABC transporter substrate-binding protein [Demequina sp.]|uniref:molybdate ABC transporter substrate-binding protein n=1 Tax=Demequina sp. TaxID=2050685 RepID=UPI003A848F78